MANNVNLTELDSQIKNLQNEAAQYQGKLGSSPSALGGDAKPTSYDISNQQELMRIQKSLQSLQDEKLKAQWYPATDTSTSVSSGEGSVSPGLIGSAVDFLSRPLYGVVGAVKHFTGQGRGSLNEDVASNILTDKSTMGDVLKGTGTPWAVSAPLGFALDLALDPVNWATMGTGALVPKMATGLVKGAAREGAVGAARGVSSAVRSSALESAATVSKFIPKFNKSEAFDNLAQASLKATSDYENLTGKTAAALVQKPGVGIGSYRWGLGDVISRAAAAVPGSQNFLQHFVYDPANWVREARIKDVLESSLGSGTDVTEMVNAKMRGESIEPMMAKARQQMAEKLKSTPGSDEFAIDFDQVTPALPKDIDASIEKLAGTEMSQKIAQIAPTTVHSIDDAITLMENPKMGLTTDPVENALRLVNEKVGGDAITLEDIAKVVNSGALGDTGVRWFDNMMNGIRNFKLQVGRDSNRVVEVGKNVMDNYDRAMGVFRVAKVAASPTAWVNAVVGNVLMNHMAVGDIGPEFLQRLKQSFDLYRNKPGSAALLDDLLMNFDNGSVRQGLAEYKSAARGTLGNIDFIGANYNAERILRSARDAGIIPVGTKATDIADDLQNALGELSMVKQEELAKVASTLPKDASLDIKGVEAGTSPVRKLLRTKENINRKDLPAGMLSNELFEQAAARKMFETISQKAAQNPGNLAWKALDFTFNKMPSGYETIDQSFKMASFLRSTVDGYTFNQINRIKNLVKLSPEDLAKYPRDGQWRYRLPANKALELANVMYLNYNAMPAAVRVLRNMPLLGSPFASFMYGMAIKTGETLAYNPAAFTKVNYALNEFGGQKTPMEKKALAGDFYSYLNAPGMYRMPFFDENPIYINLSNMIPYYSFNMFNPSESRFGPDSGMPAAFVEKVQSSPLLKDPLGSVLFDYMIQPMILGEALAPQGQFGQPLYPLGANALTKVGYGARTLGEAFVPGITAYAGLATPTEAVDYIPSYRWRQLAYAKEGKNQLGISGSEGKLSRTIRGILSQTGVPVQSPVNTTFNQK